VRQTHYASFNARMTVWHNMTIQITSDSAQVTAGPHGPWCNTEYIFLANVPHKTL